MDRAALHSLRMEGFWGEKEDMLRLIGAAQEAFEQLLKTINGHVDANSDDNEIRLVLYVDEAHTLVEATPGQSILYDAFCFSLNAFLDRPIFTIFLSTTSLPPPGPFRSARIQEPLESVQAPITETPFDCAPNFLVKPSTLLLKDICTVEFMSKFGRPLWAFRTSF